MKIQKHLPLVLTVLCMAAFAACLIVFESDYLWKMQELDLFLYTPLFFQQKMVVAGGCLSWLATYFTQFMYHPWIGVLMLAAWWVLLVFISAKTFRVSAKWLTILLIPVALLLVIDVSLDYWMYYMKLRGYLFMPTIGVTAAVALVWLFRVITAKYFIRTVFLAIVTFVAYPLLGFYGLLAIALMALLAFRLDDMTKTAKVVNFVVAVILIFAVPLLFYRYVYYQTNLLNIYWTALPIFCLQEEFKQYYIPYYLLVAFYVILALAGGVRRKAKPAKTWLWAVAQVCLIAAIAYGVWAAWYKDDNFHKELAMERCLEDADWQGIIDVAKEVREEPTRAMLMMKNLALFREGRIGDEMYHYCNGSNKCNTPLTVRMMQVVGKPLYFNYGLLNFCYRWCTEDGVEHGWRIEYLKYMAKCSLLNEEWQLAEKYINLLKKTKYYKKWAIEQEKFLRNKKALLADREYGAVAHLMGYESTLNSDNTIVEQFVMNHFANHDSDDPLMQELTLVGALWKKDIQTFWPHFFHYAELHKGQHIPIHYQEAAYLYGHLENQVDISRMPFDPVVRTTYDNFMQKAQQYAGMSEETLRDLFKSEFGHTFYYDYFLNRNQQLY